ncbi:hypothetical protein D3C86_1801840 [compost metagenome]
MPTVSSASKPSSRLISRAASGITLNCNTSPSPMALLLFTTSRKLAGRRVSPMASMMMVSSGTIWVLRSTNSAGCQ